MSAGISFSQEYIILVIIATIEDIVLIIKSTPYIQVFTEMKENRIWRN